MKVLVPYDGSKYSLSALRWVAGMALNPGSEIDLLNVVPDVSAGLSLNRYEDTELKRQEILVARHKHMEELVNELSFWRKSCKISHKIRFGAPKDEILDFADSWSADLIVMATHEQSIWGKLIHRSISHAVMEEAECSVLVVKPTEDVQVGSVGAQGYRVLLPIEGSFYSAETISWLAGQVWRPGTSFKLLMVVPEFRGLTDGSLDEVDQAEAQDRWRQLKEKAFEMLEEHALHLGEQVGNEHIVIEVVPGNPRDVILDVANNWSPDIIALGSRGASGDHKLFGSSIPSYIANHCQCSVLVVKRHLSTHREKRVKREPINLSELFDAVSYASYQGAQKETDWNPHGPGIR